MARHLPRGRVTFAFVDVVESTKTFAEHGEAFVQALAVLQERIARHAGARGGVVVKTEGDGAFLAFPTGAAAIEALVALQEELALVPAETVPRLRVRAGAHSGDAAPVGDDYVALAVNVAARVTSTVGAGQVVVSAATEAELTSPVGVCVGAYDLKDVADPVELWRVCGDDAPLRGSPARRTNVRIPVTGFVGRGREMVELGDLVGNHRLVSVVGPGGLGKTRLVSELVLRIARGIPGGAWLVELASLGTGDQVPAAVGHVLGMSAGEVGAIATEVRRRGEVVLVLDNCEHLLDAVAGLVADLIEACPELRVLCTSREPLAVPGERVWRLPPLVDQAARIELFTQRAGASGAAVPDESAGLVDRLCTALDGLPLAIELAATQTVSTPLEELIRVVESGTDDLARRGGQARQRSLDAVLSWSLDGLPAARRAALLVLSILPGRFDLDMATTILAAIEDCESGAVRPLARASLIDLDGENYRILDTIRHAARRLLAADPDLASAARRGLRAWAQQEAAALYRVRRRFYDDVPADRLLALETALEHATDDGVRGIGKLWELVRLISAVREPSDRIVALARRVMADDLPADSDEDLCFACAFDILVRADAGAISPPRMDAICAAADRHGLSFGFACLHYRLAHFYAWGGDVEAASKHADAYLRYAASPAADDIDRWFVHNLLLSLATAAGELDEAVTHARQFLLEAKASKQEVDLNTAEGNLAEALLDVGRSEEALPHALEAARLCRLPGPGRRFALLQVARAYAGLGQDEAARAAAHEYESDLLASGRPAAHVREELDHLQQLVPVLRE